MLINSPLRSSEEVLPLIKAGADFFYAGVDSKVIFKESLAIANRRPWREANFNSISDFKKALRLAHEKKKKIYLTLNNYFYSSEQISKMVEFVRKISDVDGVIAGDLNVFLRFRKDLPKVNMVVSTVGHVQNRETIKFYSDLGVKKIIFPRHFLLKEIRNLIAGYDNIKFECFIKNEDCSGIDGFCSYLEGPINSAFESVFDFKTIFHPCRALFNCKVVSPRELNGKEGLILEKMFRNKKNLFSSCGICKIYSLHKSGVESVKIVGRAMSLSEKINDVRFARFAVDNLYRSKKEFVKRILKRHKEIYKKECDKKCFYNFK